MNKPHIPKSPVPMLTEVVQVNGSLRPAVFPWAPQAPKVPPLKTMPQIAPLASEQALLADKVIARVQAQLALILPEMMRTAVDEVLNEHLQAQGPPDQNSPPK
jgi:hypothetical protein